MDKKELGAKAHSRWTHLGGAASPDFVRADAACLVTAQASSERIGEAARRAAAALREGADPRDVLVVCADPTSAARVRDLLRAADAPGVTEVEVTTGRELACSVVELPEAARATGTAFTAGRARLLSAYEADFVTEDVKTLGTPPKRLRELLKFLYRGWTELLDEDPAWLLTVEEINTFDFLSEELGYLGAVMEPQLANLATKALRLDGGLCARVRRGRVFVLDYQNLSRATQLLCQLVARDELVAVADPAGCTEVHESYPYAAGVADFARLNPAAQVVEAGAQDGRAPVAAGLPLRTERAWDMPADEVTGVADEVAAAVAGGVDPASIAVMAPHPWWAQRMERALAERGVPVNAWYGALRLRGDIRDLDRCLVPRTVTLLRLLADPDDGTAWRSWFGFGDYLTRSNLFAEARAAAPARDGLHPANVRRDLEAAGYDLGADLDPLFAEVRDLRGPALLSYLVQTLAGEGAPVPPALRPLLALGEGATAAQMVAELDRRQFFAGIPAGGGVVVSSYAAMAGVDFAELYAVGFVNGLFPAKAYFDLTQVSIDKQKKMGEQDLRTARAMARLGREAVHVSRFERADAQFAERVGVKQARIFAANDEGVALGEASPSIYTDVLMGRE
jgi:hypothetical protein